MCQREAMRERPARRRGVADSESGSSASAATSSDSDADEEPPAKKKTAALVCFPYVIAAATVAETL